LGLLLSWINGGRFTPLLPALAVLVLLTHLLGAGGIGFPGVAGSLWLLLALGLFGYAPRTLPRSAAVSGLILALTAAVACYLSAYSPVLRYRAASERARRALSTAEREKELRAAAAADPLAARPRHELAAMALDAWLKHPTPERFRRFEQQNRKALELAPNSSLAWLSSGDWYLTAYAKSGQRDQLEQAIEAYSRAVQLYPNSATSRAKLALAYKRAGRQQDFRREAHAALRLDRLTPHADKKLKALRQRLAPAP
jgi:tetratricopeptide (TPR) repeat protein